jgi:site-specific recombinase XerD
MEERRYSRSTIDTYLSMLRQFMAYHSPKPWDKLNKDDIVEFNYAIFIRRNRSYSTQIQAINAIKLFYAVLGGLVVAEQIQRPRKSTRLPKVLTKEDRPVPLSSSVSRLLDKYVGIYAPGTWLFEGTNGGQYSHSSSRQLF